MTWFIYIHIGLCIYLQLHAKPGGASASSSVICARQPLGWNPGWGGASVREFHVVGGTGTRTFTTCTSASQYVSFVVGGKVTRTFTTCTFVWGFEVLLLSCACVSVSAVLFSVGV